MNSPVTPIHFDKPKKNRTAVIVLSILLAISVLFSLFFAFLFFVSAISDSEDEGLDGLPYEEYVGVLHIEGTISSADTTSLLYSGDSIYSQEYILTAIDALQNDENNKGILLYIDTPGGEVYATDEVYTALLEYKTVTKRPIYAYFASYACSGGYYIAMAADEIYAHRMSTTGSIGVTYGTHIDLSGLCEKLGIGVQDISSGDNKAMGSYFAPLTEEQIAIYESQLDECYGYFVDVVEAGRGLSEDEVKAVADGRTYTAKQAKDLSLIDGIGEYEDYAASVSSRLGNAVLHDLSYAVDYTDLLYSLGYSANGNASEIEAVLSAIKPLSGVLVYYSGR